MKNCFNHPSGLAVSVLLVLTVFGFIQPAGAQSIWSGASGTDTNWSNPLNWSPSGVPGTTTNVVFDNVAAGAAALTNNVVNNSLAVASLMYTNSVTSPGNYQGTLIAAGQTLTVTNGFTVGWTNQNSFICNVLMAGPGALAVTNNIFVVQQGATSDGAHQAVLDLSGLNTFTATVSRFGVGYYYILNGSRSSGVLYLAKTNVITVLNPVAAGTGPTNSFVVDYNPNSGGSSANNKSSAIYLGQTNLILADGVAVGSVKSSGSVGPQVSGGLMAFNPNGLNNPAAFFRNTDGVSRISYWQIGDDSEVSASNQGAGGTNDFSGGIVNALINNLGIGLTSVSASSGTTGNGSGLLTFVAGTIDANNLTNGWSKGSGTAGNAGVGVINVNGTAILKVNTVMALAMTNGATGTPAPSGTLNVGGGTVTAGSIVAGSLSSTVNLVGGTLNLTNTGASAGTLAKPVGNFSVSNSILNLAVSFGVIPIEAGNLTVVAPAIINVPALPSINTYPVQFPLVQYTAESGDLTTFTLGSLPTVAAVPYQGYLSNNTANLSVDLVVTNGFLPIGVDVWTGTNNANWDMTSPNWLLFGNATLFVNSANVQFDDSAAGTTGVNLVGNLAPSTLTVSNNLKTYTFGGSGSVIGSTSLVKNGTGTLIFTNSGNNSFSGGILISNGTVQFGNGGALGNLPAGTPAILDNGNLVMDQNGSITITNNLAGTGNFIQAGSGVVSLSGANVYNGQTLVGGGSLMLDGSVGGLTTSVLTNAPGTTIGGIGSDQGVFNADGIINPGDVGGIGTLTAANGLTVYTNGSLTFDLNSANNSEGGGVNDLLQVTGNLTVNNTTIAVNIQGGLPQLGTSYPVLTYSGALSGSFNPVVKSHFAVTVDALSTPGQVNIVIAGTNGATLKWNSTGGGTWDLGGTANWFNFGTSASDVFDQADSVLFDDSVSGVQTNITIPAGVAVYPSAITNISSANNYTISGGGTISGPATLIKGGTSTLTINTTNSFTGGVIILNGTVKAGSGTALGVNTASTFTNIIANGATFDEFGQNMGSATFLVSGAGVGGNGALINSGSDQSGNDAFQNIVLAGDTTFGGPGNAAGGGNTPGRWDIRGGTPTLTCQNGNPYNITKVGSNQVTLVSVTVDPNLANITVQGGVFGIQGSSTLGNPANSLVMYSNTLFHTAGFTATVSKVLIMTNAAMDSTGAGANNFAGPVTLAGSNSISLTDPLTLSGGIGGPGSLIKTGGSILTLSASNTYTGNTTVGAGTVALVEPASLTNSPVITISVGGIIDVSQRGDQTLTLNGGQALVGGGAITGSLTNMPGSTLSFGSPATLGTLGVSSVAGLQGTTTMKIKASNSTGDQLDAGSIVYGGTLSVANIAGTITNGQTFVLFVSTNGYSGAFGTVTLPTAAGLTWTNNLAVNGTITAGVVAVPSTPPSITVVSLSGTNLVISGTNGTAGGNYEVLTATNLLLPLSQWTTNVSSQFDGGGNFSATNGVSLRTPQQFYLLKTP